MFKKLRLTDRTRMLLQLELALTLPAVALMAFSIWNLKHIQRDKAIEAAIQRDFSYVLKIAEKKSWERANGLLAPARKEFPNADDGSQIKAKLEHILREHPEFSYAALYDKKNNVLISRTQPGYDNDPVFCGHTQDEINMVASWLPLDASNMAAHLRMMAEKEEIHAAFEGGWMQVDHQLVYWNIAYFIPPDTPKDRATIGVVSFNTDYLRHTFFPAVIKDELSSQAVLKTDRQTMPAMMIHPKKDAD